MIKIVEVPTFNNIPSFVPYGVLYFTIDTSDLYIGTGNSTGPAVVAVNGGGGGSSVQINSVAVTNPNFNDTTPAASGTKTNVTWQKDVSGNVSAQLQLAQTKSSVASNWINAYNAATGVFTTSQPAFTDISGVAVAGQIPNLDASKITTGLLALARGGTNADLSATGGASQFLRQNSVGAAITVVQPAFTDISGTATAGQIPNLDASKITTGLLALARGGTNADLSATGGASQFLRQNSVGAAITVVQPAFSDLSGSITAGQIPAGTVVWNNIGNATGALTLANGGNATTFNQTSAVTWLWANTTAATSGVSQSSPLIAIAGQYWTGAASAADQWTIQDVIGTGTNGTTVLTFAHSGSTAQAQIQFPSSASNVSTPAILWAGGTAGFGIGGAAACAIHLYGTTGGGSDLLRAVMGGTLTHTFGVATTSQNSYFGATAAGYTTHLYHSITTQTTNPGFRFLDGGTGATGKMAATSGSTQTHASFEGTFQPASGASPFVCLQVKPTVNQTSTASGSYTGILLNVVETALLGSANKFLTLQGGTTGGTTKFEITNAGVIDNYNAESTAAVGVAYIRGSTSQKSETGADASVLSVTPAAAAGRYRLSISMQVSAASAATLGWTATWTDSNGTAQAPTNLALFQTGVAAPALTFSAAANGNYYADCYVDINNAGTAIVIKTTFSGTSIAYKVSATIERVI